MEFHDSYLGDRLKEAFAQELGQQYVPDLDALTSNPGNMDVLMKFSTEIPGADTKRLISSLNSHYASHAANDPTFERLKAVAAEKIAIAMVNHLSRLPTSPNDTSPQKARQYAGLFTAKNGKPSPPAPNDLPKQQD